MRATLAVPENDQAQIPRYLRPVRRVLREDGRRLCIDLSVDRLARSSCRDFSDANGAVQARARTQSAAADNPQVFMWVSGHTHTAPSRESFASAINLRDGRVMNIHCTDMQDRSVVWTNSLFLYPDRVVVKTFDHGEEVWMRKLEREISRKYWRTHQPRTFDRISQPPSTVTRLPKPRASCGRFVSTVCAILMPTTCNRTDPAMIPTRTLAPAESSPP